MPITSTKPDFSEKSRYKSAVKTTVKLTDLLKVDNKKDQQQESGEVKAIPDEPFTPEQLHAVWMTYAEKRKMYQAEYHLLSQPYELQGSKIVVQLLHPVQETMLNNLKSEITLFLRETLKNNSIIINGELAKVEDKKIMYTARDKFDFLIEKNPILKELKDRLGLDTDF